MLKILKNIGKGLWREEKKPKKVVRSKNIKPKKTLKTQKELSKQFFTSISHEIEKNGYKSIRVSKLVNKLGIGKRTEKAVQKVIRKFKNHGLYTQPIFSKELKLSSTIRIYNYPVRQLGEIFETEKELENFIADNKLYKKLNIKSVIRQYSPSGSRDRLDFKGKNNDEVIVLELKNKGGGKSAVEQVFRYSELLKSEFPSVRIRKILVPGIQNYETALAINGLDIDDSQDFEWYLYKYFSDEKRLEFIRVSPDDLSV